MIQLGKILTTHDPNREEYAHFQIPDAPATETQSPRKKPAKTPNTPPTHPPKSVSGRKEAAPLFS